MRVSNDVLEVLSVAAVAGNTVRLVGQLDRALYVKTDKVLQAAGGKWDKKAKAHVFDSDAETRIDEIIVTGEIAVPKDEYNYFPTPPNVVAKLLDEADLSLGMMVLEPSAGRGAIVAELLLKGCRVSCVELDPRNVQFLANAGLNVTEGDFLSVEPLPIYDRVVMNPPFMGQADIKHINHALQFLKPGGVLVAVMSAGVMFRENKLTKDFRAMVEARDGHFIALPEGSFKSSGTMVNTVIVVVHNYGG
jgi:predicted RNA methylase